MLSHPPTIGRYAIQRPIGQGAMGMVYLAEDPLLKRQLAIKVVRAVGEERDLALERFKREAEISAQLNHPNIVTIYDVGEEPALGPFLAMEYVEGKSLGRFIREGVLEAETCFAILIQTMRALRAAHRHAIIHRDVKPDNILVGEDGRVKLMDFGIARTMAPRLTSAGEFLGSPAYSSPELLKGGEPTPGTDRFAFAVTAFELLTGQLPHPGASVAAVITHVLHEPPVIPAGVPAPVGYVFRKALDLDPEARHENLMEFLTELIDAYPLEEGARFRVSELFRHDDHAGDIVPLRKTRPRPAPFQADPSSASSTGGRMASGRATAGDRGGTTRSGPILNPSTSLKIELESGPYAGSSYPAPSRPPAVRRASEPEGREVKTLVKWILLVLVAGNLFWWLYGTLQSK